jgi:predicted GNAT superfamily acetyltransferase
MERYRQQFPKLITVEDWLAKAHPGVPALPWKSDDGEEICSFTVMSLPRGGGIITIMYDAHGREVTMSGDARIYQALDATALALGAKEGELLFLPAALSVKRPG